jgi:molybdate transport system ATP-binding protein
MLFAQMIKTLGLLKIDLTFQSDQARVIALFGPSGAGKTSVISMIAGLIRPDSGEIRLNGSTFFDSEKGISIPPEQRRIGYVFQDGKLFPHLTVRSNLEYGMKRIPKSDRRVGLGEVVNLLGIESLLSRRPGRLSGGEKQRVAIGRALLTSPKLLLMDEPLASLDTDRKQEVLPFVRRLKDSYNIPIIYVSHSPEEVASIADRVLILKAGRLEASGGTDLLLRNGLTNSDQ